jgi:NAD(P)-dependent dehydrogenase (short-subunit alcohol dehydrogenase family)
MTSKQIVLVTGGTRGIGSAIVERLAESLGESATVLVGCRKFEDGTRIADRYKSTAPLVLDVASDQSIQAAVEEVKAKYGRLDILINNAGGAVAPTADDLSELRQSFQYTMDLNVSSVAVVTQAFLPLLRASTSTPKVIQISSGRASLARNAENLVPPSRLLAYTVSKAALNMLTLDMARAPENEKIEFQLASPGHCSTALNGFRGARDPLEGAQVVVELVKGHRREIGCYETVGADPTMVKIPW